MTRTTQSPAGSPRPRGLDRRTFLRGVAAAGLAASMGPMSGCSRPLLPQRYQDLSPAEVRVFLRELEEAYEAKYRRRVEVSGDPPLEKVVFGYGLDLSRCVGCRSCVYACADENNQSRDPQIHWIRVLEMEKAKGIDFVHADAYYDREELPEEGHFYLPVACMQCDNPPCVKVCPVKATWQEPDGIVVIDYDWCIGCRYCMAACPYGARHFNWTTPGLSGEELQAKTHVLGNRPRPAGVVEKCTFCIQRVRQGLYPACVEVCPVGARKFGNLLDPSSEIIYAIERKRVLFLKEELNTKPKFFYFYAT